jgi:dTDP-glucose 4,6-dehydratase
MKQKILVTGVGGFIASNFVASLLEKEEVVVLGIDIISYCSHPENIKFLKVNPNFSFIFCDITNAVDVDKVVQQFDPDMVINFAAESHVDKSIASPIEFIKTNIIGVTNLLNSTKKCWIKRQKNHIDNLFVQISTDEVFGSLSENEPAFVEENNYKPNSPYSASKASGDHLCRAYRKTYGMPIVVTNCSNNFGPRQFPEKLIPNTIQKALNGEHIPIYGNGKQIRDWIFVDDHSDAILKIMNIKPKLHNYNIGGDNEIKNIDLVNQICDVLDKIKPLKTKKYNEQIKFVTDRPGHDFRYAVNSNKLKTQTDWIPSNNFNLNLEITIKWYLENKNWLKLAQEEKEIRWVKRS